MTSNPTIVKAGAAYFAIVFAAGFALGTVRTLFLAPRFGELFAVVLELPVMLAVSWIACGWVLVRFAVPRDTGSRLGMGGVAFGLLMLAEVVLSVYAFGRSVSEYADALMTPHGLIGLGGQVIFGALPWVRARW